MWTWVWLGSVTAYFDNFIIPWDQTILSLGTKPFCELSEPGILLRFCKKWRAAGTEHASSGLQKSGNQVATCFSPLISWDIKFWFFFSYTGINITILTDQSMVFQWILSEILETHTQNNLLTRYFGKKPNFCCNKNLNLLAFCCCRL